MSAQLPCAIPIKILMLGESGVGKSSIMMSFTSPNSHSSPKVTIAPDCATKLMQVGGKHVSLTIWDTAGQERFRAMTTSFFRNAHGAILVYDVSDVQSLAKMHKWYDDLRMHANNENIACLLLGNKIDQTRAVERRVGQAFASENGMMFQESSAVTKENIISAFTELVQKILDTPGLCDGKRRASPQQDTSMVKLDKTERAPSSWDCNCVNYFHIY